uniref:Piwi domain-containing protein n=1 Tax=Glossina pallidipes TaxID=7398 RepID=A0A1B0AIP1_GLOPL
MGNHRDNGNRDKEPIIQIKKEKRHTKDAENLKNANDDEKRPVTPTPPTWPRPRRRHRGGVKVRQRRQMRQMRNASVIHNLMLKVNAKLNGTYHRVLEEKEAGLKKLLQPIRNVMFMGADVTHPSPDQRHIPSVVGVAASHDVYGACYNMHYQNRYPEYIIYYRDIVSDGQFPKIRKDELGGIRRACTQVGCNPKITCLTVVKRHHTRFFPLRQSQGFRDFNNVEPGTVVDQYIVHPNEKQFFLVSHKAIQGTAKPTRYNVIEDDSNFDIDLLQKLSYNLRHIFRRCNRAVSYPAPAYLAHLVAFRGRVSCLWSSCLSRVGRALFCSSHFISFQCISFWQLEGRI